MTDRAIARAEESILRTLRLDHDDAIDDVQRAEVLAALATLVRSVLGEKLGEKLPAATLTPGKVRDLLDEGEKCGADIHARIRKCLVRNGE